MQLQTYVGLNGPTLTIGPRRSIVEGRNGDATGVATFVTPRARYTGVVCLNAKLARMPGAEVWSIVRGRREIARFAIHNRTLVGDI